MTDPIDEVLRLVAEGRLTAEEAAPVLDALQAAGGGDDAAAGDKPDLEEQPAGTPPRALRVEVTEGGRRVVNLRIPLSLGRMALDRVPGLTGDTITRIREALDLGLTGPIVVVDEGEDAVRIVLE
jgi:hypothetical protein